jgi:hypothetical protein
MSGRAADRRREQTHRDMALPRFRTQCRAHDHPEERVPTVYRKRVERLVRDRRRELLEAWNEYFGI